MQSEAVISFEELHFCPYLPFHTRPGKVQQACVSHTPPPPFWPLSRCPATSGWRAWGRTSCWPGWRTRGSSSSSTCRSRPSSCRWRLWHLSRGRGLHRSRWGRRWQTPHAFQSQTFRVLFVGPPSGSGWWSSRRQWHSGLIDETTYPPLAYIRSFRRFSEPYPLRCRSEKRRNNSMWGFDNRRKGLFRHT